MRIGEASTFNVNNEVLEERESARSDSVVCSDVMGQFTPLSRSGFKYIVTFILMKRRFVKVYPLRTKVKVAEAFEKFCK